MAIALLKIDGASALRYHNMRYRKGLYGLHFNQYVMGISKNSVSF